jgi:hypothetical protein
LKNETMVAVELSPTGTVTVAARLTGFASTNRVLGATVMLLTSSWGLAASVTITGPAGSSIESEHCRRSRSGAS